MLTLGALIFPGFELLDLYGPLEMFGMLRDRVSVTLVAETAAPVAAIQATRALPDATFESARAFDLLLVPGGMGTRREVDNAALIGWLSQAAGAATLVTTVCTGAALLARTGLLDGRRATTNKAAFRWVESQGPAVQWQARARWVEDGKYLTSSGVSAGMDMALAAIARVFDLETARGVAHYAEYRWNEDAGDDPFAAPHALG